MNNLITPTQKALIKDILQTAIHTAWNTHIYDTALTEKQRNDPATMNAAAATVIEALESIAATFWLAAYGNAVPPPAKVKCPSCNGTGRRPLRDATGHIQFDSDGEMETSACTQCA